MVAKRLGQAAGELRIIDHVWVLTLKDKPWGFVTEPNIDVKDAERALRRIEQFDLPWLQIQILSKAESAWDPGNRLPIVVSIKEGALHFDNFVRWALRTTAYELQRMNSQTIPMTRAGSSPRTSDELKG